MLQVRQLKLKPGQDLCLLESKIRRRLHLPKDLPFTWEISRKSLDARKKPDLYEVYTVNVKLPKESAILKRCRENVSVIEKRVYRVPLDGPISFRERPVIIGSGPAGLFCTYLLASKGYRPILLERGKSVEERMQDVESFWQTGRLNPSSNVQFGEGGAGTFSDGKLNTLVKDKDGRNRFVLETFVQHGADPSILYENKPHIGTDVLVQILKNMRNSIQTMGGEIRFQSQVTDFEIRKSNSENYLQSITVNQTHQIQTQAVVLAPGHSARDTFALLARKKVPMEAKAFAVGLRIEHPQDMIDYSQYGRSRGDCLPPASYKVAANLANGRGVYSFCMCPGGYVVNASSEEGGLAVNGMSYSDRGGCNANSALIVTVTPEDFKESGPLAGISFQRQLETTAYHLGKGRIPVQRFDDFCQNRQTTKFGAIQPQTKGACELANLRGLFSEEIAGSLEEGIRSFDHKIKGFAREDALLFGVESRTSSPVRILRNSDMESEIHGLFPCGEGAGYAGGIMSAAMDGMKVAEAVHRKLIG